MTSLEELSYTVAEPTELAELQLARDLRAGSDAALSELFDRHADRIYHHCFRSLGTWSEAEDATSEVFLQVWRHRKRVEIHDDSAVPWLYGVATNVCRNLSRKQRRGARALAALPTPGDEADHAGAVADRLDSEVQMDAVLRATADLSQPEREVLELIAWDGLDYAAAAAALGVPLGTVKSRLSRARARLTDHPRLVAIRGEDS